MPESLKKLLLNANPPERVGTMDALGEVSLRRTSMGTMQDFANVPEQDGLPSTALVNWLIAALAEKSDGVKLTPEEVETLSDDNRTSLVTALIDRHDSLFAATEGVADEPPIDRDTGESDEDYLARGFRAAADRNLTSARRLADTVRRQTFGMSEALKAQLSPGLAANRAASDRLRGIIGGVDRRAALAERLQSAGDPIADFTAAFAKPVPAEPFKMPEIPPHPAHETNALLGVVSEKIGTMHALAVTTAEMQQSLNDTAATALTEFSKGAEASAASAADGLWMAKVGLGVAVVTAMLTLAAIIVAIVLANNQSGDTAARDAALAASERAVIATESRLAAALEDHTRATREVEARRKAERDAARIARQRHAALTASGVKK